MTLMILGPASSARRIVSGWEAPPGPTRRSTFERQAYATRPSAGYPTADSGVMINPRQDAFKTTPRPGELECTTAMHAEAAVLPCCTASSLQQCAVDTSIHDVFTSA